MENLGNLLNFHHIIILSNYLFNFGQKKDYKAIQKDMPTLTKRFILKTGNSDRYLLVDING